MIRRRRKQQEGGPERRIEPPNDAELRWIGENLEAARSMVGTYTPERAEERLSAAALDLVWERWLRSWLDKPAEARDDPNPAINAVGLGFGQVLVDELDMQWAVVSDEHGTDLAVHTDPEFLVFPANLVAKRLDPPDVGFLEPIYEDIGAQLRQLR